MYWLNILKVELAFPKQILSIHRQKNKNNVNICVEMSFYILVAHMPNIEAFINIQSAVHHGCLSFQLMISITNYWTFIPNL